MLKLKKLLPWHNKNFIYYIHTKNFNEPGLDAAKECPKNHFAHFRRSDNEFTSNPGLYNCESGIKTQSKKLQAY